MQQCESDKRYPAFSCCIHLTQAPDFTHCTFSFTTRTIRPSAYLCVSPLVFERVIILVLYIVSLTGLWQLHCILLIACTHIKIVRNETECVWFRLKNPFLSRLNSLYNIRCFFQDLFKFYNVFLLHNKSLTLKTYKKSCEISDSRNIHFFLLHPSVYRAIFKGSYFNIT